MNWYLKAIFSRAQLCLFPPFQYLDRIVQNKYQITSIVKTCHCDMNFNQLNFHWFASFQNLRLVNQKSYQSRKLFYWIKIVLLFMMGFDFLVPEFSCRFSQDVMVRVENLSDANFCHGIGLGYRGPVCRFWVFWPGTEWKFAYQKTSERYKNIIEMYWDLILKW